MPRGSVAENSRLRRSGGVASRMNSRILAEAEVEHLVGLIEHDDLHRGDVEPAALQMVAQAPGRADDDVGALVEQALLLTRIHAADAGDDAGACRRIKPGEFALHLQGQFAGGCHHQRLRRGRRPEALVGAQQRLSHGEAIGHGLAGAGLRGNQQVAPRRVGCQHGELHRRRVVVVLVRPKRGRAPDLLS